MKIKKSYEDGWSTYKDANGSEAAFFRPKCPSKPEVSNISWKRLKIKEHK